MKLAVNKRTRIILLFLLGIGVPSLLLGYLAYRGVQNDQALLEKDRINEHRKIAEMIVDSVHDELLRAEQAFLKFLAAEGKNDLSNRNLSFESLKSQSPLIEEVFSIQGLHEIHFPDAELLYRLNGSVHLPAPPSAPSLTRLIQSGQQSEFQRQDYSHALLLYRQALRQASSLQSKGEVWGRIARVQKKSKLYKDAIETYQTIAKDFDQIRVRDGIPLGLTARLEIGTLFAENNKYLESLDTFIELYRDLIDGEWVLEQAQFEFSALRLREFIQRILSQESISTEEQSFEQTFLKLTDEERIKREKTARLLLFQENAVEEMDLDTRQSWDASSDDTIRLTLDLGREEYLVSLFCVSSEERETEDLMWGILLDFDYFKNNLLLNVLKSHFPSDKTDWMVRDRNREIILATKDHPVGSLTLESDFKDNFPHWTLEFYQPDPQIFETFLIPQRGVYFYMFILIAGILIFGLIFTIRSITHEIELSKMKSDFVSTVSHEFKSPLTSIRQIAEMLHSGRVPSEERRQKYYDVLLEQSERLSLLTENVLSFAKMEEGKREFVFEYVDMETLLTDIVSTIQDRVRHDGFTIETEIEKSLPSIMTDASALTQAVNNLIDNAVKYSGDSKKVKVKAYKEGEHVIIAVKDFGVGIEKEEMGKVFDRFYRGGDELTRTVKGSGLGLTLVKQIVEAHKGSIQVESEPGRGSLFAIKLPLDPNKG
jgi:signal transduction histidine kinase